MTAKKVGLVRMKHDPNPPTWRVKWIVTHGDKVIEPFVTEWWHKPPEVGEEVGYPRLEFKLTRVEETPDSDDHDYIGYGTLTMTAEMEIPAAAPLH